MVMNCTWNGIAFTFAYDSQTAQMIVRRACLDH